MWCKTRGARLRRSLKAVYDWCRRHRHLSVKEQHAALVRRVNGHPEWAPDPYLGGGMIMTRIQFDLFVSYSQVAVFTAGLDHPFNDWEQEHVDQGFAWREGSVSFATLEEASALHCEAVVADGWRPHPEAERAIRVPFSVAGGDSVEIASISDGCRSQFAS